MPTDNLDGVGLGMTGQEPWMNKITAWPPPGAGRDDSRRDGGEAGRQAVEMPTDLGGVVSV